MRATTDSEGTVAFDQGEKPGISNLMNIYSSFSGLSIEEIEKKYRGCGYGDFKKDLVEVTVDALHPIRSRYQEIRHSQELIAILQEGAEKAGVISEKTMKRVKDRFGLGLE